MRSRALVLGGSGAVGRAVLRGLAATKIPSAFTWRSSEETAAALAREGHHGVRVDLRDGAALTEALRALGSGWGAPDVLIHVAGVAPAAALARIGDADWDAVLAVNVRAAFIAARELAPGMVAGGDILFCTSLAAMHAIPTPAHVAASGSALLGLARALSKELGGRGIRVNLLALGPLEDGLGRETPPKLVADFKKHAAFGRVGSTEEAARAILWAALQNDFMTGSVIPVTGGL